LSALPIPTELSWSFQAAQFVEILHGTAGSGVVRFWSKGTGRSFDQYVRASEAASVAANKAGEVDQFIGLNPRRFPRGRMAGIEVMAGLSKGQGRAVPVNVIHAQRAFMHQIFGLAA
jgi:hypothetical protein